MHSIDSSTRRVAVREYVETIPDRPAGHSRVRLQLSLLTLSLRPPTTLDTPASLAASEPAGFLGAPRAPQELWRAAPMSKERPAGHSGKNKVNEFDQDAYVYHARVHCIDVPPVAHRAMSQRRTRVFFCVRRWSSVFDTMTKEREEQESAEAISSREAMQAVKQMLENLVSVVFLVAPHRGLHTRDSDRGSSN